MNSCSSGGLRLIRSSTLADSLLPGCDDGCVSIPVTTPPVMTRRKERGLEIFAREKELSARQSAFERERTRIFTETGQRVSGRDSQVSEEERAVRAELRALGTERAGLLAEIAAQEAALRGKQSAFAQARNAAAKMPGRGKKKAPVSKAEQKIRAELALLQSERAYVDGTVGRDRESAETDDAIWNTCHDPETFGTGDW